MLPPLLAARVRSQGRSRGRMSGPERGAGSRCRRPRGGFRCGRFRGRLGSAGWQARRSRRGPGSCHPPIRGWLSTASAVIRHRRRRRCWVRRTRILAIRQSAPPSWPRRGRAWPAEPQNGSRAVGPVQDSAGGLGRAWMGRAAAGRGGPRATGNAADAPAAGAKAHAAPGSGSLGGTPAALVGPPPSAGRRRRGLPSGWRELRPGRRTRSGCGPPRVSEGMGPSIATGLGAHGGMGLGCDSDGAVADSDRKHNHQSKTGGAWAPRQGLGVTSWKIPGYSEFSNLKLRGVLVIPGQV